MSDLSKLSDNAIQLWMAFFLNPKSTLSFGGDQSVMEITPEARAALDELLNVGAAEPREPDDQWPGREYYKGGPTDLHDEIRRRPYLNPFSVTESLMMFRAKES
jgi:hypothetical protein